MAYRWADHTAELELRLECATEASVFEDALAAYRELVDDGETGDPVRFEVTVRAADRAALLGGWLDELVFHAETESLVPDGLEQLRFDGDGLTALVRAHRGHPRHLVKGVTLHRLSLACVDGAYRATVVLDV